MRIIHLAAGLLVATATPATAEEISQRISTISVASSDIVQGEASARLQARITRAVENVCGTSADTLEQFADLARCKKLARAAIAEQLARQSLASTVASRK